MTCQTGWLVCRSNQCALRFRTRRREYSAPARGSAQHRCHPSRETGTAELAKIITHEDGTKEKVIINNAVFISFAPIENPKIAIAVIAEGAGYGGSAAAPIAKQVYLKAYELGYFDDGTEATIAAKN